jgi:hypothetical protein
MPYVFPLGKGAERAIGGRHRRGGSQMACRRRRGHFAGIPTIRTYGAAIAKMCFAQNVGAP